VTGPSVLCSTYPCSQAKAVMSEPYSHAFIDLEAFDRRFRRPLMGFFLRRVGNQAEAEDLTQEVFVRLARAERPDMKSPDAYIFQIAANLVRDRARMGKFRLSQTGAIAESERRRTEPIDAERTLIGKDNFATVLAVLKELNPRTRDIFLLNRLEGLSHNELAEMFGISASAVGKHIYKATTVLATRLGDMT
jgi:RNA polymerase sigma factor (sigma-70 family)